MGEDNLWYPVVFTARAHHDAPQLPPLPGARAVRDTYNRPEGSHVVDHSAPRRERVIVSSRPVWSGRRASPHGQGAARAQVHRNVVDRCGLRDARHDLHHHEVIHLPASRRWERGSSARSASPARPLERSIPKRPARPERPRKTTSYFLILSVDGHVADEVLGGTTSCLGCLKTE